MRVYDPAEDLPPPFVKVVALIKLDNSFTTRITEDIVYFDPSRGWKSDNYGIANITALKWSDAALPTFAEKEELINAINKEE